MQNVEEGLPEANWRLEPETFSFPRNETRSGGGVWIGRCSNCCISILKATWKGEEDARQDTLCLSLYRRRDGLPLQLRSNTVSLDWERSELFSVIYNYIVHFREQKKKVIFGGLRNLLILPLLSSYFQFC